MGVKNRKLWENPAIVFFALMIVGLVIYHPTRFSKFVSDFYDWISVYDTQYTGMASLFNSFGYPSLHIFYHVPFFIMYKCFSFSPWPWHIVFLALHAANAMLIYSVAKAYLNGMKKNALAGWIPALLFFLLPYQTEVVVWAATIHYLVMAFFLLISWKLLLTHFETSKKRYYGLSVLALMCGLFTHEQALVFSMALLPLIVLYLWIIKKNVFRASVKIGALLLCTPLYFLCNRMIKGVWIGHYGSETHLTFDVIKTPDVLYLYIAKFFTFFRYLPQTASGYIQDFFTNDGFQIILPIILIGFFIYWIRKSKTSSYYPVLLILFLFAGFVITLLPVINIDTSWTYSIQADRYGYIPSIFVSLFLGSVYILFSPQIRMFLTVATIGVYMIFLLHDIHVWQQTGEARHHLIHSFKPDSTVKKAYLLNLPDNFDGAYLFRNGFQTALSYHTKITTDIAIISLSNMISLNDSAMVTKTGDHSLSVSLDNGRWFMHGGRGGISYDKDNYSVEYLSYMPKYILTMHKRDSSDAFFAFQKGKWEEVTF